MTTSAKFQKWYLDLIRQGSPGFWARCVQELLSGLSHVYKMLIKMRAAMYGLQIFKEKSLGAVVVSVGNITLGGTGKTPVVEMIAQELLKEQRHPAIISRGYRRKKGFKGFLKRIAQGHDLTIVSDGKNTLCKVMEAGDEPFMMAGNLPGVPVIVCTSRVKAASYAIETMGCDTIILDDGYQYLQLKKTVNVLLVDSTDPFGNGALIPRGELREPKSAVSRADYIIFTKVAKDASLPQTLLEEIKKYNNRAETLFCAHKPQYYQHVFTGGQKDLKELNDKKIMTISGIAKPEGFEECLKGLGCGILKTYRFADHHFFADFEIQEIMKRAEKMGASAVVTTEKDAVRIPELSKKSTLPVYFLKVKVEILHGEREFVHAIASLNK